MRILLGRMLMTLEVLNGSLSLDVGLHPLDLVLQTLHDMSVVLGDEMLEALRNTIQYNLIILNSSQCGGRRSRATPYLAALLNLCA